MANWTPTPERLRAIAEHVYSLGAYTQAAEIALAAERLEKADKLFEQILRTPFDHFDALERKIEAYLKGGIKKP